MAAQAPQLPQYDTIKLREIIARSDYTDLRLFCADLGEDYNAIVGEGATVRDAALSITKFFDNRGRVAELVARVQTEFPSAEWDAVVRAGGAVNRNLNVTEQLDTLDAVATVARAPGPLRIFICHASPDKASARTLYAHLKAIAAQPWLDEEDLIGGQDWQYVIRQAVENSDVVLVCLSRQSVEHDGFVKDEIGFALTHAERQPNGSIFVVPLRLEDCTVPERLRRWHWVDWFGPRGSERLQRTLERRVSDVGAAALTVAEAKPMVTPLASPVVTQPQVLPAKSGVSRRAMLAGLGGAAGLGAVALIANQLNLLGASVVPTATATVTQSPTATNTPPPTAKATDTPQPTHTPTETATSQFQPKSLTPILTLTSPLNMDFVLIPAGSFLMGSDKAKDSQAYEDEFPQHSLTLGDYYIGKTEVTNAQFAAFVQATGYKTTAEKEGSGFALTGTEWKDTKGADWRHPRGPDTNIDGKAQHPVVQISWHDAIAFCDWLSSATGRKVTLPSEAEWEKVARSADGRIYSWGDAAPTKDLLNFNSNVGDTTPIGQYSPKGDSPYGAADMAGNVWEWTRSLWGKDVTTPDFKYPYVASDGQEDLNAADDVRRVVRGGAWNDNGRDVRAAFRVRLTASGRANDLGLRVVISAPV